MRILLIEDDTVLGAAVRDQIAGDGHSADWVTRLDAAGDAMAGAVYDLVLLDLMLPDGRGIPFLKRLRARNSSLPVLILTAVDGTGDRVKGLDLGADDYMVKPFDLAELEARVRALCRRSAGTAPTIQCGSLVYDQIGRVAQIDGQTVDLSAREIGLLEVLLTRMGRLVSKDQLVDKLCGWGEEVSHNAIEVYVHRLRKKLEAGGVKIATVRGLGYCLERPQAE